MADKVNHTILQGLLRSGIKLETALEKYHLHASWSKRHPHLVQIKYDQIESDFSDPLVRQCRGIIYDSNDNWEIVARPFDKFFNYGEPEAAKIDWSTAKVLEKLDGTCCILYFYDGWHVATLGSCDASGTVGDHNFTFAQLFWATFQDKGYHLPDQMWSGVTFIFELMTPDNRIVVPHKDRDLKLLGARIANGSESSVNPASGFEPVPSYNYGNLETLIASFASINPLQQEGYVVVDGNYNRIKVKHPGYVRIHQMKDQFTLKNIVNCVRNGEAVEFINYFPEHKDLVLQIKDSVFKLIDDCNEVYESTKDIGLQKTFALEVKDFPFSGILFAVRNGRQPSIVAAIQHMHIDNLVALLESRK
jgi:hypothetical protein